MILFQIGSGSLKCFREGFQFVEFLGGLVFKKNSNTEKS